MTLLLVLLGLIAMENPATAMATAIMVTETDKDMDMILFGYSTTRTDRSRFILYRNVTPGAMLTLAVVFTAFPLSPSQPEHL